MEPSSAAPPRWQHPVIAIGVTLFVVVTVVAAISFAGSSTGDSESSSGESDDEVPGPGDLDESNPLPTLPLEPPVGPAPVLRVEVDRPARQQFVDAVETYFRAWRTDDETRLGELTWSGCEANGAALASELDARFGDERAGTIVSHAIVVSPNIGATDVSDSTGAVTERLLFQLEEETWRSGLCSAPDGDLATLVQLPADLTDVAGLRYENESMAAEVLQNRDLAYAVFDGATLTQANLFDADIEGASFIGADLVEIWAPGVDAGRVGAGFDDADLTRAVFRDADLAGSSFAGADARSADFSGAVLDDVDFRGANLDGAFIDQRAAATVADWTGALCPDGETAAVVGGCLEHLSPYG